MVDLNAFDHTENALQIDNLGLQDPERDSSNKPDEPSDLIKWTQEKDDILINNYAGFESLGKRACYEMLAMLIPGTTAKQCYTRGKELKLKKVTADEARVRSRKLIGEQSKQVVDKKVMFALQKFILQKLEA